MSAEKERRYQELFKNRFVNPIDQGVGRRTGWVLNKAVRKDSEGFELFDDYWSDSGEESTDDLSLHANKENKRKAYKLSSPITHMPDFTPSSHASTDVEPLSDVGSKSVPSNSTLTKTSSYIFKFTGSGKTRSERTQDSPLPAETENGLASKDDAGGVVATPNRDEGGIQESYITGSIIKGGNSFQVPNSVVQEFKTKTRLSFGVDVDEVPGRRSTWSKSARALNSHCDNSSASSDAMLTRSQSDVDSEGQGIAQEKLSTNKKMSDLKTSSVMQQTVAEDKTSHLTEDKAPSALEKILDKQLSDVMAAESSSKETSDCKEITATNDSESMNKIPTRKSTTRKLRSSVKQPTADSSRQTASATKRLRRKRRNVTHVEEDTATLGDEGMFISLQKSFVSRQDGTKEMISDVMNNILSDQSFHDADDEEVVDIVDDNRSYYKSIMRTKGKSRGPSTRSPRKSVINKDGSVTITRSTKVRAKKGDRHKVSKNDFVDFISDEEVPHSTEKIVEPVGGQQSGRGTSSSGESGKDVEKPRHAQQSKSSQRKKSTVRDKFVGEAKSSSGGEPGPADLDIDTRKGSRAKGQSTKRMEQSSTVVTGRNETYSTGTDENEGRNISKRKSRKHSASGQMEDSGTGSGDAVEEQDTDKSMASMTKKRSLRGKKFHPTDNKTVEQAQPEADTNNLEIGQVGGQPGNTDKEQIPSSKNSAEARSRKSALSKHVNIQISNIQVISDDAPAPMEDGEDVLTPESIPFPSNLQMLNDEDGSSPRKKFKGTPGVKLLPASPASIKTKDVEKKLDEKPQKKHDENPPKKAVETGGEDMVAPKKQGQSSSSLRGGRKRGGKRKLYSGDLPSSFLDDPSLIDAPSTASITNADPTTSNLESSFNVSDANELQGAPANTVVNNYAPNGRRGRGKGKGRTRGKVGLRKTQADKEPSQDVQEQDNVRVVLDFLTKYESGKESGSTDSEYGCTAMGHQETYQSDAGDASTCSSGPTAARLSTTVYPEPTPRSILKRSLSGGVDARKKNLSLQFFEVPRPKAIIVAPDETENGRRRTKRNRVRPVEFWRNERPEYQRRKSGGFVLVGVQSPAASSPEHHPRPGRTRARGSRKLPQTPANLSVHASPPPGSKLAEHPAMVVINPDTQEEVEVDTLRTSKMNTFVGPSGKEATADDPITLCKSITQKAFSSGILTIRPLSEKGLQFVQNDTMVFYITRGKVSVTIHHTTSILQNGDMFFVPQGNMYNIKNLRRDEAKLVFFQHKGH